MKMDVVVPNAVPNTSVYEQDALLQVLPLMHNMSDMIAKMETIDDWKKDTIRVALKEHKPLKDIMPLCRVALLGRVQFPSVFPVMEFLGKKETIARLRHLATHLAQRA